MGSSSSREREGKGASSVRAWISALSSGPFQLDLGPTPKAPLRLFVRGPAAETKVQLSAYSRLRKIDGVRCLRHLEVFMRKPWLGLALVLLAVPACAQEGDSDLANKLSNPISDLISVPFQFNYDCCFGPEDGGGSCSIFSRWFRSVSAWIGR
jgi:hypothetical protein